MSSLGNIIAETIPHYMSFLAAFFWESLLYLALHSNKEINV